MTLNELKSMKLNLVLFFLFNLALISCNDQNKSSKAKIKKPAYIVEMPKLEREWVKKARHASDTFFRHFLSTTEFNGQFFVAKNATVIYSRAIGKANLERSSPITDSTPIHVASISKVATSLAVLRLCDQKKIVLDKSVKHYLKKFPFPEIRVRDLLTHRSGLPQYYYFTDRYTDRKKTLSNEDVLKLMIKYKIPLNFRPNSHFTYCNTNFVMLALIVEEVTGQKFPKAMKRLVFDPLEMKHTFILHKKSFFERISQSYSAGKVKQAFTYLDLIYGDKNMYTTAKDLFRMNLGTYSPKFLSTNMRKEMFRGYSYEKSGERNYGLGIRMIEEPNSKLFYHTGWWHGNLGMFAMARKDTICVIAISNVYNRKVQKLKPLIDSLKLFN